MSKTYPSIPDPLPTIESLTDAVRVLKMTVELLTGQRGSVAPTKVYVQSSAPTPEQAGDMWINSSTGNTVLYWNGSNWIAVKSA